MEIRLIRNATLRITYAGKLFVIDPCLGAKHSMESFAGISPNPVVDLPCTPEEALAGAEMVIVSHLHPDHIDPVAIGLIAQDIPIFCQPGEELAFTRAGFGDVRPIETGVDWEGIAITRTPGQHGTGMILREMGPVSGFLFRAAGEPTLYWAGDTVYFGGVERVLKYMEPDVIVTHSCGAQFPGSGPIVMDAAQTIAVCNAAPRATVIATHMEALDHATVTRAQLRDYAEKNGIPPERLLIPDDGETVRVGG